MLGVDISEHNGKVNYWSLLNSGVEFVIIRLGYGDNVPEQDDFRWDENVHEVERLGIPWAAYIYSYATSCAHAISEAEHCARLLEGHVPAAIYFDSEEPCDNPALMYSAFASRLSTLRNEPIGLYCSESWYNTYFFAPHAIDSLWIANWSSKPPFECDIWQYTDALTIDGIAYDGNECDGFPFGEDELPPEPTDAARTVISSIADAVLDGAYGNDSERVELIESIAENSQDIIDELYSRYAGCPERAQIVTNVLELASMIMLGGLGDSGNRIAILDALPELVQSEVNERCL